MRGYFLAALLITSCPGQAEALPDATANGWYTWRVPAAAETPGWCCVDWNSGQATPIACLLDGRGRGYSSTDGYLPETAELQVYALLVNGKAERIRPLSPACPVESTYDIIDLGRVAASDSLDWLKPYVRDDDERNALPAIAMHRGPEALNIVSELALRDQSNILRERAVFWLGQLRIADGKDTVVQIMFADKNSELRKQAGFSLAQSKATDKGELLIRQGRSDPSAEVRGHAWFSLSQSGVAGSEAAILQAMQQDRSADVREQAVFALSQLPDGRGVASLMRIVSDQTADRELRERALFWLASSDSDEAYALIDRLLSAR